ncbi:PREDICTED: protein SHOOT GRAVITROPISM 5-like [Nicotiana attenuata]|uniref:Protein shoot gravitropism 5 n=1 Tax=Nicotiana attenuata TaxID=49451 RepID=A0A1J6IF73_NICAT|nr:PREDICTED: protein SHOOT GRAVITROPISM 5-like [Nicotiana attenuata]OIS96406.1 protein shoot gravitropism 5 [Nicotiana attenuata]
MLDNSSSSPVGPSSSSEAFNNSAENSGVSNRRKRRPAGTPDPDAEVVSLSPKTLLESDRYICEICNQGFQRDQNLQMHRRRHKVPWKLVKRETPQVKKRVFVCPEPTCLHHDPCHALGDLVGIKKHFRRKHSNNKQWVCEKCSKAYAVQSDYKAHLKTCGTRGHSCDCGRVFSRVESFIEHQDNCTVRRSSSTRPDLPAGCSSRTASSTSPSSDTNFSSIAPNLPRLTIMPLPNNSDQHNEFPSSNNNDQQHNLELRLLPSSIACPSRTNDHENQAPHLKLSIGSSTRVVSKDHKELNLAMAEKAYAEEARRQAKRQIEFAELEFANAKRIRQQAQAEIERAQNLKEEATKRISSSILEITCHACKNKFQATDESSQAMSYMSSATTEAEGEHY